jgi:uncharacterized protein YndB with AHSA1/START domain
MSGKNEVTETLDERQIVITRLINAPRNLVFEAWTDPKHLINWWGPDGFTNTFIETDIRKGGKWNFIMHGPDGTDWPNLIEYDEFVKPERLAYRHGSGVPNDPEEFSVVVTFEDRNGKTFLTMRSIFKSAEIRNMVIREHGAIEGGNQTLDKLERFLVENLKK